MALLVNTTMLIAQSISGVVLDSNTKEPIIGASILIKGTSIGTISDVNGKFTFKTSVKQNEIEVSYVGYKKQTINIGSKTSFEILLSEDTRLLEQVVVIGYGTQKKSDLTGAVSSIKSEDISKMPTTNVAQALQGKASGVEVVQNSGAPGSSTSIRIRGMGTINNSDPLYVVDGISMDNINYLSSEDIASVEILKDASSAAIYGSRAANGVVLIATKNGKGSSKAVNVTLSTNFGTQEVWKQPNIMDKNQYIYFSDYVLNQYVKTNKNATGNLFVKKEFQGMLDNGNNWWDMVSRTAMLQKYYISVSGGDKKLNYYISGDYQKTDGVIKQSGYSKKTLNAKINTKLTENLTLGSTITYAQENKQVISEGTWGIIKTAINYNPLTPLYDINGSYTWTTPIENLRRTSYNAPTNSLIGQITLDWNIIKDLKYSFRTSYMNYSSDVDQFVKYNTNPEIVGTIQYNVIRNPTQSQNFSFDNILNYSKKINDHEFSIMGGQTFETSDYITTYASGTGYGGYSDNYDALYTATMMQNISGYNSGWTALSFLGRVNYSYKSKYLFQSNFRADGSSRFSKANRWGFFPSASLGWKINAEPFFEKIHTISLLKMRVGWGQLGNNRIGDNAYQTTVSSSGQYIYGNGIPTIVPAMSITQYGNENIKWERTVSTNFGLDLNLFDNKFTSSFDLFSKDTYDMLIAVPIVYSAGYSSIPLQNAGSVRNLGYEIQASYRDQIGKLNFDISGNVTQIKNKVTSLGNAGEPILGGNLGGPNPLGYTNRTVLGVPIGCFYGYKTAGILTPLDFSPEGKALVPVFASTTPFQPGDMKFVDVNKDGKIDENDKTFLGSPQPDLFYGFNVNLSYKGFDLSMFFQGVAGNKVYNVMKFFQYSCVSYGGAWNPSSGDYSNVATDYYSKVYRPNPNASALSFRDNWGANPTGLVPAPNSNASIDAINFGNSDFYIEDASYIRLKNIQLGYTFAESFCHKIKIKNLRIFVSATNLLTFTKYTGLDPEVGKSIGSEANNLAIGIDEGTYPQARTYLAGLVFNF
jgi:TonB-dependent starch-binding outer membrane protein SusC